MRHCKDPAGPPAKVKTNLRRGSYRNDPITALKRLYNAVPREAAMGLGSDCVAVEKALKAIPDLLAALEERVVDFWGEYGEEFRVRFRRDYPDHPIVKAEDAIAKATAS